MTFAGLRYNPLFDDRKKPALVRARPQRSGTADRTPEGSYVFDDSIRLRINLALATGRPLLVRGPSGTGKSALAPAVAFRAGWNYAERAITSRTQAQDLLYEFDQLKRLQDAHVQALKEEESAYLRPGPLFFAFDARKAKDLLDASGRGHPEFGDAKLNQPWVVLLDEIDKADPDVPNNLLVPLGRLEFELPELRITVRAEPNRLPLIFMTTNEERDLPPAFLRRCIELVIGEPDKAQLIAVARAHRLDESGADDASGVDLDSLADYYVVAPRRCDQKRNAAEFLDFVRAWRELELTGDEATRRGVLEAISGRVAEAQ